MSEAPEQYVGVMGVVFKVEPAKGIEGGRWVRLQAMNYAEKWFDVTVWGTHADVPIARDDLIIARGKYTKQEGHSATFHKLSVKHLWVLSPAASVMVGTTELPAQRAELVQDEIPF